MAESYESRDVESARVAVASSIQKACKTSSNPVPRARESSWPQCSTRLTGHDRSVVWQHRLSWT